MIDFKDLSSHSFLQSSKSLRRVEIPIEYIGLLLKCILKSIKKLIFRARFKSEKKNRQHEIPKILLKTFSESRNSIGCQLLTLTNFTEIIHFTSAVHRIEEIFVLHFLIINSGKWTDIVFEIRHRNCSQKQIFLTTQLLQSDQLWIICRV